MIRQVDEHLEGHSVGEQDTYPGDVSWGMSLEQAKAGLAFLHALPHKRF